MSFPLASVSLSGATTGTTGKISLNSVGVSAGGVSANPANTKNPASIFFFNDSGCGLQITFSTNGQGFNLPAGGWAPMPIPPGENTLLYTVLYVLPNPPVSLLIMTYFQPGESVPQSMTLGNSPVGIGGSVQTSSVQTLSNEGNASGTLVIDTGDTGFAQVYTLYNDGHCTWAVDQTGVKHQVIKVQSAGNPLLLGQAADSTEILGNLIVDGASSLTGLVSMFAGMAVSAVASTLDGGAISTNGSGLLQLGYPNTAFNGSVSGSANIYTPIWGVSLKILIVAFNNYNSANAITFALPSALGRGWIWIGNQGGAAVASHFESGGVPISVRIITALASTGGSTTTQSNMFQDSMASIISSVDTWKMAATAGLTSSAIICIGV